MEIRLQSVPRLLGQGSEDQRHLRFPRIIMAVRKNPDGSISVGILREEPQEAKPEVKAEKPKRTVKTKAKGES